MKDIVKWSMNFLSKSRMAHDVDRATIMELVTALGAMSSVLRRQFNIPKKLVTLIPYLSKVFDDSVWRDSLIDKVMYWVSQL